MTADFLLELRCEEIPARMQEKARADLARLFPERLAALALPHGTVESFATPRRLALIVRDVAATTTAMQEERKGPRVDAPDAAVQGFLRSTGLTREKLVVRDDGKGNQVLFAIVDRPGVEAGSVLASAILHVIHNFPWPKSMRWGAASLSTESLRWVRPLQGIVALLGDRLVPVEVAGIASGHLTVGHRFHAPGPIAITSAATYADQLRAAHVILDGAERRAIIAQGAARAARDAGLELIEDEGLLYENAGLTEWPVPLLGRFDPAFLDVPPEVIQLTARVNQKYFVCSPPRHGEGDQPQAGGGGAATAAPLRGPPPPSDAGASATSPQRGGLANAFVCVANIDAADGGARIVEGNQKVLAARLADARFFYEQDLKVPLEEQAKKLESIVFHEKLGTVADKVARVAKLARWLCEEGIIPTPSPPRGEGRGEGGVGEARASDANGEHPHPTLSLKGEGLHREELATLAERAAMLCKADLVTGMVGEFPELQGIMGGYYAAAQGEHPAVAAAIRDHYKPVGQGDDVPTDPVTVAVSLADKLDTLACFFAIDEKPTGSKDPFALRRAALSILSVLTQNNIRLKLIDAAWEQFEKAGLVTLPFAIGEHASLRQAAQSIGASDALIAELNRLDPSFDDATLRSNALEYQAAAARCRDLLDFFADRLKVQQREAGVRHDLIDAVFALGGEDDLVRLLARVHALQAFMATEDGTNLLAGYKRAANILKKEGFAQSPLPQGEGGAPSGAGGEGGASSAAGRPSPSHPAVPGGPLPLPAGEGLEPAEAALIAALDAAEPLAAAAIAAEDFAGAMAALATLRGPIDAFFENVTVNDPDPAKRAARLALLARMRDAVHRVADFSKIEG